jgi:hypothetical protein
VTAPGRPVWEQPFVCLECGARFGLRELLVKHWHAERHGPAAPQRAALERFRVGTDPTDARFTDRTLP